MKNLFARKGMLGLLALMVCLATAGRVGAAGQGQTARLVPVAAEDECDPPPDPGPGE